MAFSILAIALSAILSVFSTGLRTSVRGDEYSHATALAEAHLAALRGERVPPLGIEDGEFDATYAWTREVRVPEWHQADGDALHSLEPYEIRLRVHWEEGGRKRSVELATVRLWSTP